MHEGRDAMEDQDGRQVLARRVRQAVAELEGIRVLPQVGAQLYDRLRSPDGFTDDILPLIEVSPGLLAVVYSLAHGQGLQASVLDYRLGVLLRQLPQDDLRQALLGVCCHRDQLGLDAGPNAMVVARADLVVHSVAVACAARAIASQIEAGPAVDLAYTAGLLHDVGKLALHQALPKGYARLAGAAKARGAAMVTCEREQLGTDHAAVGAYLAKRWHLPTPIQRAIWLHHAPRCWAEGARSGLLLPGVVQLADALARSLALGISGSADDIQPVLARAEDLGLSSAALNRMRQDLAEEVTQRTWRIPMARSRPVCTP
jgi:putative nucleotidyltransferase with HDIG domain